MTHVPNISRINGTQRQPIVHEGIVVGSCLLIFFRYNQNLFSWQNITPWREMIHSGKQRTQ